MEVTEAREWNSRRLQALVNFVRAALNEILETKYGGDKRQELNDHMYHLLHEHERDQLLKQEFKDLKERLNLQTFIDERPLLMLLLSQKPSSSKLIS
jgi:cell shape-determining protein MreC